MANHTGHGGRHSGGGRKATDTDEPLMGYSLTLRLTDVGALNRLGEGNLSRGVRRLIDLGKEHRLIPPIVSDRAKSPEDANT